MTIYATPFDAETRKPTGHSANSGFVTLEQVVETMGPPVKQTDALAIYPGAVLFSRTPFYLGPCRVVE